MLKETLYIKDNDTWEKDNDKSKIKKAIEKHQEKIIMQYVIGQKKIQILWIMKINKDITQKQ